MSGYLSNQGATRLAQILLGSVNPDPCLWMGFYTNASTPTYVQTLGQYTENAGGAIAIDKCDAVWNGSPVAGVSLAMDPTTKFAGAGAARFGITTGVVAGIVIGSDNTGAALTTADSIIGHILPSASLGAGDFQILLCGSINGQGVIETLNVPACLPNTWNTFSVSLANPSNCASIVSVALKMVNTPAAYPLTVSLDSIHSQKAGYSRQPLLRTSWTDVGSQASYAQLLFTAAGGDWGNQYGYFLATTVDGSGVLMWAEQFSDGPYNVTNGKTAKVTPNIAFGG